MTPQRDWNNGCVPVEDEGQEMGTAVRTFFFLQLSRLISCSIPSLTLLATLECSSFEILK